MARSPIKRVPAPGEVRGDSGADIREELELYLDLRTEELIAEGMDPGEARREAEARFGNRLEVERRVRRASARRRGLEVGVGMGQVRQDVLYALRSFARNPGFTAVAVLTLAVALAGNTAIFSVLDAAVLRALPFRDHERLVFVNGYHLTDGQRAIRLASVPEFRDWQERSRTVRPMVAVDANSVTLSGAGSAERVSMEVVSEGFFDLLGGEVAAGRTFTSEEYLTPDGYPVVVISHDLWTRRFGGDPSTIGGTFEVNARTVSVVGVMSPSFRGVNLAADVWAPIGMMSLVSSPGILEDRESRFLGVVGRLADGVSIEDAQGELDAIARDLQAEYPDLNENRFAEVQAFRDGYLGSTGRLLWILFGAGILLLAIASANVANLLLVRANARTREFAVRRSLGASGSRVARQLLVESVLLAGLGGAVGLVLAGLLLRALPGRLPPGVLPAYATPDLSPRVFLFTLGVLALAGIASGSAPAFSSLRRSLASTLRSGGRGSAGGGARAQQWFVVIQVGLALTLMVGAGLLTRSFAAQLAVDPGLETEGVHAFIVVPPRERYPDAAALRAFTDQILQAVGEVPGVENPAASSDFPFRGGSSGAYVARQDDPENQIRYHRHSVTPGYFRNLGVELRAGRFLEASDAADARGVAVVTQAFVDRVFPEASSGVGEHFWVGDPDPSNLAEIVGVVENVRYRNLTQDMMEGPNSPDVFFAYDQVPSRGINVSYRLHADPATVAPAIRRAVAGVDPGLAVFGMSSLEALYLGQTTTPRFAAFLMSLFGALAISLACVGIYGILAFAVGQRGPEIAVRRALGAGRAEVARTVVFDGLRLTGIGLLVGGTLAYLASGVLQAVLFEVSTADPATFAVTAAVMLVVALMAAAIPASRAARKPPADALTAD